MADVPEKAVDAQARAGERTDSCLLSFVAGYVDTCVFVGLFGLFTALALPALLCVVLGLRFARRTLGHA